jgi:UDP-N-acetylmuramyl pentapeptide phosphotransferase/UDP-N-acetylglucosamine-1-phosphate transferase
LEVFILATLVFLLAYGITRYLSSPIARFRLLDHPNERSLHAAPTPRTGGLAILGSLLVGLVASHLWLKGTGIPTAMGLIVVAFLIGAVSFWDDYAHLPPGLRFGVHCVAAVATIWGTGMSVTQFSVPLIGTVSLGWAGPLVAALFLIWMTNLYNFMDGMDGFAGGMTVLGFGIFGVIAMYGGHQAFAILSFLIMAATGGFLVHNMPPARIFMGDVGSAPLGFLAGGLALKGIQDHVFDLWVPILVFSPFIADATTTLLRRLLRGEKVWRAHREHYYQRLVLSGWTHRRTVSAEYVLMVACGVSGIVYTHAGDRVRFLLLIGWLVAYIMLARGVSWVEGRRRVRGEV